jgi:predicted thioesterase
LETVAGPALSAFLTEHHVDPALYATPWFLSVFSSEFSMEFSQRVLDFVLLDGP